MCVFPFGGLLCCGSISGAGCDNDGCTDDYGAGEVVHVIVVDMFSMISYV